MFMLKNNAVSCDLGLQKDFILWTDWEMYVNLVGSVQVTIFTDLSLQIVMATTAITELAEI